MINEKDKNFKLIGVETGRNHELKDKYAKQLAKKKDGFGMLIYKDLKKKTLKIEIMSIHKFIRGAFPGPKKNPTAKEIAAQKKRDEEWEKNKDKPIDTSNWPKPDEESIRNALIKYLALCELYKEDTKGLLIAVAKRDVLYSILHSKNPTNPQGLTTYHISDDLESIFGELGNKRKAQYTWKLVDKVYEGGMDIDKMRLKRKQWRARQLAEIVKVV